MRKGSTYFNQLNSNWFLGKCLQIFFPNSKRVRLRISCQEPFWVRSDIPSGTLSSKHNLLDACERSKEFTIHKELTHHEIGDPWNTGFTLITLRQLFLQEKLQPSNGVVQTYISWNRFPFLFILKFLYYN